MAAGDQSLPVNRVMPPWGRTDSVGGQERRHPEMQYGVQHPNIGHVKRPQVSPFRGGEGYLAFLNGLPRFYPQHSAPGGLHRGARK